MQEKGYCYLADAIGVEEFKPETYENIDANTTLLVYKKYKDPDDSSIKLYDDLVELWSKKGVIEFERDGFQLKDSDGKIYSSDFIGPSRAWARRLLKDKDIGEYLKEARTIGGHMIWPKRKNSINQMRGGASGFFDRIDFTLAEIKNYCEEKEKFTKKNFKKVLAENKEFFQKFDKNFNTFIEDWKLEPFVVKDGNDYKVISLVKSDLENGKIELLKKEEPIFPGDKDGKIKTNNSLDELIYKDKDFQYAIKLRKKYENYIRNNVYAIKERNEEIFKEYNTKFNIN